RSNLFLVPLDTQRSWYRYHHLFADVLHARLLAERPEQVRALHGRASDWFSSHNLTAEAVRHALAAEDFDRAAYLMEEALPNLRRTRQDSLMLAWSRSLPDSVVRRSPVLSILSASSLLMSGDLDAEESRLNDADAALSSAAQDQALAAAWADTHDLRTAPATVSIFRASLAQARGDVAGTVRHARHALDLAGPEDHLVRAGGSGFLGLAAWAAGDVPKALDTFGEAVRSLHAAGNLVDELDATIVLADLHVASGRPAHARRLYEKALRSATGGGEPYPRAVADLHVGLAELDRELNDLASAEVHLETARVLGEQASITENRHRWFMAMAQLRAALGDYDTATELLDQAQELYRHGFYPDVRPIAAMKVRVQIAGGDLESATGWLRDRGLSVDDDLDYLREYEHLTLARLLLARHRVVQHGAAQHPDLATRDPVAAALGLLERLHAAATVAGRDGSLAEIRMLQALTHHALGDLPQALVTLSSALVEAPEPESYVRLYLDEGPPMVTLLQHAASAANPASAHAADDRSDTQGEPVREWVRRLLIRARTPVGSSESQQSLSEPLSRRELEVLRLLDSELTGPEIARELYVTVNTLRTHTKRIFTKLDANTRAAAVQSARDRGLL
ncbi:MAG: LuxR C-terminal-related transcriptional regulator, partial [Geodermatophilaceae bacterium]